MTKLTPQNIDEIIKLYSSGIRQEEISLKFKVSQPTISYWLNPEKREEKIKKSMDSFKSKSPEEKKKLRSSRKDYMREYMRRRYNNDPLFKEKVLNKNRKNKIVSNQPLLLFNRSTDYQESCLNNKRILFRDC